MKKLNYNNIFLADINEEEEKFILDNIRQRHIEFKGHLLKTIGIEILGEKQQKVITKDNALWSNDMAKLSTPDLKEIIGDFEGKYNARKTGKIVATFHHGHFDEGILAWLLEAKALIKKECFGIDNYYVITKRFDFFKRKENALEELKSRREFARNAEVESYEKTLLTEKPKTEANLFEEDLRRKSKEANIEEPKDQNREFIGKRELKDGEIDVNLLPL